MLHKRFGVPDFVLKSGTLSLLCLFCVPENMMRQDDAQRRYALPVFFPANAVCLMAGIALLRN